MQLRTILSVLFLLSQSCIITARQPNLHQLPSNDHFSSPQDSIKASDYPSQTIQILIDHYNASDSRTFSRRYWANSNYYRPGGPVFYFDSGEHNVHPLVPYFLAEAAGPSAVMALARRFNGLAVLFEHRFYGDPQEGKDYMVSAWRSLVSFACESECPKGTYADLFMPCFFGIAAKI